MNKLHFSIVLPVFNGAGTLGRSLRSIRDQTLSPHEVIVVDDGSTDATHEIVSDFATILPLVSLRLRQNQGLVKALQSGVALARSPWIARLDADDVWLPHHLARLASEVSDNSALVASRALIASEGGSTPSSGPLGPFRVRLQMCWDNPFVHSAVAFSAAHYARAGGYRHTRFEDYDLWSRLSSIGDCSIGSGVSVIHFKNRGSLSDIAKRDSLASRLDIQRQHWSSLPVTMQLIGAPALALSALRA